MITRLTTVNVYFKYPSFSSVTFLAISKVSEAILFSICDGMLHYLSMHWLRSHPNMALSF